MVDPLEAKRLAAKQMEVIKGRERQQRRREIEAINGAWAIIGLTIGLIIEAQTGKGIVAQVCHILHFLSVVDNQKGFTKDSLFAFYNCSWLVIGLRFCIYSLHQHSISQ